MFFESSMSVSGIFKCGFNSVSMVIQGSFKGLLYKFQRGFKRLSRGFQENVSVCLRKTIFVTIGVHYNVNIQLMTNHSQEYNRNIIMYSTKTKCPVVIFLGYISRRESMFYDLTRLDLMEATNSE